MPVTRAVIDAMIASGCPAEQAAGLAEWMQISTVAMVNPFPFAFPHMQFYFAMSVPREFRVTFIHWRNAHSLPDNRWEPEEELGAWEDVVWPDFEQAYKAYMLEQVAELQANQSTA